jgi:hypothetical protein
MTRHTIFESLEIELLSDDEGEKNAYDLAGELEKAEKSQR